MVSFYDAPVKQVALLDKIMRGALNIITSSSSRKGIITPVVSRSVVTATGHPERCFTGTNIKFSWLEILGKALKYRLTKSQAKRILVGVELCDIWECPFTFGDCCMIQYN